MTFTKYIAAHAAATQAHGDVTLAEQALHEAQATEKKYTNQAREIGVGRDVGDQVVQMDALDLETRLVALYLMAHKLDEDINDEGFHPDADMGKFDGEISFVLERFYTDLGNVFREQGRRRDLHEAIIKAGETAVKGLLCDMEK